MSIPTWLALYTILFGLESVVRAVDYFSESNFLMCAVSLVAICGVVYSVVAYVELRNQVLQEMRSKLDSDK